MTSELAGEAGVAPRVSMGMDAMPANPPGHTTKMEKNMTENMENIESFDLPSMQKTFELHPEGRFTGVISNIVPIDPWAETPDKPRIRIVIETDNCPMSDGRNFAAFLAVNLSAHEKSSLYQFRAAVLGRAPVGVELEKFNKSELVGLPISYRIIHVPSKTDPDRIYANIRPGSVEHMDPNFVAPLPPEVDPTPRAGVAPQRQAGPPPPPPRRPLV